ncbi:hypothetical protein M885DRAFT_619919 [Pelagophyceae sp. CCMP2097]|nr:hypothetical protein M885DRAFT_619919 [Pelagophyceae sp. CCMP2097]
MLVQQVGRAVLVAAGLAQALRPPCAARARGAVVRAAALDGAAAADNVAQTQATSRDRVMTFAYDTERERAYAKPVYKGTGDGLGGDDGEYDVVVIGSGMGGLACGAMSAKYGEKAIVLESHIKMGGSAHSFSRMHAGERYSFEVGPSIFEGLDKHSLNPLRILLDTLGEKLPVETYNGLGYWVPTSDVDGSGPVRYWRFQVGDPEAPGGFYESLREFAQDGELAIREWEALRKRLKTLGGSTMAVSLLNLRQDAGFLATTAGSLPFVATHPDVFADLPLTFDSLHKTVDALVTEPFLRNFIDTMCIFCGFPAKGAMTAHMLYILERFFETGCAYSVPLGGTENIARAIHRGGAKFGMDISLNTHVDEILVDGGRAVGVRLKNGKVIKARKAVVSNATPFDTVKLLPADSKHLVVEPAHDAKHDTKAVDAKEWRSTLAKLPRHGAILHLFVAIDAELVVDGKALKDHACWKAAEDGALKTPAHLIVQDWSRSMQDSQNLCSFFIPSLCDPSVCPPGKHVVHVYSSGGEPYEPWEALETGSSAYEAYKEERAGILWKALENVVPDARQRALFHVVGSPLAHEAFLRRDRGTYGMAWAAGTSAPYAGLLRFSPIPFPFPNFKTPIDGLLRCGDSCFPGIGTPSAAASGVIAANTLVNVEKHIAMLEETSKISPLYKFLDPGPFQWLYRPIVSGMTPSQELRGAPAKEEAAKA